MTAYLAVNALEMAVAHRGHPRGVKVHSDRGSQFRSKSFTQALERHGLVGSMGRVGAAGDNAAMESPTACLRYLSYPVIIDQATFLSMPIASL